MRDRSVPSGAEEGRGILLFDGVCNLCSATVRFVARRDAAAYFSFAPLQSPLGRRLLEEHGLPPEELSSVVLVEDGRAHTRSDAALRVARRLSAPWSLLWILRFVPRILRDGLYDRVASSRYRWFGTRDACEMPSSELRDRFLS